MLIRLTRTIYIGHELRLGRFVAEPHAHTGRIHFIWFRRGPHPNLIASVPYRKPKDPPPMPKIITKYERLPVCDRNLDQDIAHGIAIMLDRYCEWLNAWLTADKYHRTGDPTYSPPKFLDQNGRDLYGSCHIDAMYDSGYFHVVALTIHDGDEGGCTSLTGWWADYGGYHGPAWTELRHITQEFDTSLQVIQHDGNFINTPDNPRPEETP